MKRKSTTRNLTALDLPTLKLEGGLFLPEQLEKAAHGKAEGQTENDYGLPKGIGIKDEYSRAFQIACAQWQHFANLLERQDLDLEQQTRNFVSELMRDALGYSSLQAASTVQAQGQSHAISFLANGVPVLVAPASLGLDEADSRFSAMGGGRRKSVFQAMQELLNASPAYRWGVVSNGRQLRLLRDAASLTRPSFLEIDLADLLGGKRFTEFALVWHLLHASRAPQETRPDGVWERWRQTGLADGIRVRAGLREGVQRALLTLGSGFLAHPDNETLRQHLQQGELDKDSYFQQLLRLVYRLIFLFTVEDRNVLHPQDDSSEGQHARAAYAEGYALGRLRNLCLRQRARNHHADQWQSIRIVFKSLAQGEPRLALPALGGLFSEGQCPDLDKANLSNAAMLHAIAHLRWTGTANGQSAVDYRNMGPEELGSVYESLLELVPTIDLPARRFGFVGITEAGSTAGNARKTSGSYYTPDILVQELIRSALDPVIEQRLAANPANPVDALLSIRLIDPACGSGHFLLAAARRLAERVAQYRVAAGDEQGVVRPQDYRHALREVVSRCTFGVDRNPMAIELARTALWLEGYEEGRPLSFLDHHLQVGDALLGLTSLQSLEKGIPKDAFKMLSGDDKKTCSVLAKTNTKELKDLARKRDAQASGQRDIAQLQDNCLTALQAIERLPEDDAEQIAEKASAYDAWLKQARDGAVARAADALLGAYLLPKRADNAAQVPTTATLYLALHEETLPAQHQAALAAAQQACRQAHVFHWPLAFPQVFAQGGFDCVLGNPPWERIKLQEEEFFATRHPDIAQAKNKAERSRRIQWLSEGVLRQRLSPHENYTGADESEIQLYDDFIDANRTAEAASTFFHVKGQDGGRFPLTGIGDVNTYALFAETITQITHAEGRAGFIVPSNIATDDGTKRYFGDISMRNRLVSLYDFENRDAIFPVHRSYKFCLLTLGAAPRAEFLFFANQVGQLADERRRFRVSPEEFKLINPNTLTCPVFRSVRDAELTKKLYRASTVLINETRTNGNPWGMSFLRMMDMATDSHLFTETPDPDKLPLYEAKMIHQFDHRWATYTADGKTRDLDDAEKADPSLGVTPRYWVSKKEVEKRLKDKGWDRGWLMGWRDICRATDERTVIVSAVPRIGVGNKMPLMILGNQFSAFHAAGLLANLNALVLDFIARQKIGGTTLNYFYIKQFPILSPDRYTEADLAFITPRVLELTYTAHDMRPWAKDLGFEGDPFVFNPERRALLRAELDAWHARLYGLNRDELRYILDPADVMGDDYPSETFRVLKNKEMRAYGEYRTQRLVLDAWDRLETGELK